MKKYIFFLDIDGTVYVDGKVPEANADAICNARELGHKVFINTARSFENLPGDIKSLPVDGFITSIGSDIYIDGKHVLSKSIPIDELADVMDYMEEHWNGILYEGRDVLVCSAGITPWDKKVIQVKNGAEFKQRFKNQVIGKSFIEGVVTEDIREYLEEKFLLFQHAHYAEFSIKGYNKATGMDYVAQFYDTSLENCVAMGDSDNDIDMLQHAGISVAMGNGTESVKNVCDYISANAEDAGVAKGIEYVLNYRRN